MRIVNRAHLPWFIFVIVATLFAAWLYVGNFSPESLASFLRLPDFLREKPSEYRNVGGTPLGLIFGAIALLTAAVVATRSTAVAWFNAVE